MPARPESNRQNFGFLKEAYRSFKKKQYANASVILEKSIQSYTDDPYPYFLLAVTRLYCADLSGANIVMEKLQRISPAYAPFVQLRAFLGMKSASGRDEAIAVYLSAIEKAPSDRLLRRGLRKCEDLANFSAFQKKARITDLVEVRGPGAIKLSLPGLPYRNRVRPRRKKSRAFKIIIAIVVIICAVVVTFMSRGYWRELMESGYSLDRSSAEKIDMVDISGSGYGLLNRVSREPAREFYTSPDIMIAEFNEAKRLMKKGEFNRAAMMLNKIINSNSSQVVKEKCEFLVRFIIDSDDRIYEAPDVKGLQEKPWLYRGVALDISGITANEKKFQNGTGFTLMVDYDGKNFKWIAQVFTQKVDAVENGDSVRVEGVYISGIGTENRPYISSARIKVLSPGKK